jgi:hypothetical protein
MKSYDKLAEVLKKLREVRLLLISIRNDNLRSDKQLAYRLNDLVCGVNVFIQAVSNIIDKYCNHY